MKLAYIISIFPKASETFIYREILSLKQLGLNPVIFACTPPSQTEISKLSAALLELKEQTFYLSQKESFNALMLHPFLAIKLSKHTYILKKKSTTNYNFLLLLARAVLLTVQLKKQQVTHLHAHWPYSTVIGAIAVKNYKCNFSTSIHAHEVAHENGHFATVFPLLKFASFCNRAAMDFLNTRIQNNKQAAAKSHLIYHGVNISEFDFFPIPGMADGIKIISAGRLTKTKGFHRLVKACGLAKAAGINIHLTILGTGPEKELIESTAKEFNFNQNLHLAGWIPHDKVVNYIKSSHVFALMADTNYHDGLPNVVLESMASGRPIIISPLPAAEEVITNGKEGFILESSDDFDGFKKYMVLISQHVEKLESMSLAARKRIENEHADYIHIKKLATLFN